MESMKTEQQRIAIAKACGWSLDYIKHHAMYYVPYKDIHIGDPINDLNAIHEAWKTLTPREKQRFEYEIYSVVIGEADYNRDVDEAHITNSTSAQRAEAFLKTIGKWVES